MILDTIAGSKYSYDSGASGTVTVPTGVSVTKIRAHATSAGTLTITPKGANQSQTAGSAIPLPAAASWFELDLLGQLGPGSILAFVGTDSYFIEYAKF